MFETLLKMTEGRQQSSISHLAAVQTPLVTEDDLYRVRQRRQCCPDSSDNLLVCQDIEHLPRLNIVLQSFPLLLGEAGVLQVSVAYHIEPHSFVECLSGPDGPNCILGGVDCLFADNDHILPDCPGTKLIDELCLSL